MPRRRRRVPYQQLTDFERGRIIGLREAGWSYRDIAARVGRNATTIMRAWRQWSEENRAHRRPGSGRPSTTTPRDDRHLYRMCVADRTATSTVLAQQWGAAVGRRMSASTVRRRLISRGLMARVPLLRIPLTQNHRRLRLQWAHQHQQWQAEWQQVVFSDESRFNLQHHDGRIRVRRHRGERDLPECILQRHSGQTPGVMVWGAISYHGRSRLIRIDGNLNSDRYIREVVQPEVIPFLQNLPGAVFQQDNARPHVARNVLAFFQAHQTPLFPWPARSPDMYPIEHVWDRVAHRLARQTPAAATVDELYTRVDRAWQDIPQALIQSLFDSMPRRLEAVIASHGGFTRY